MKSTKELTEYLAQPDTVMKVSRYTYLFSAIMTSCLAVGWFILMVAIESDMSVLSILWLLLAWKLFSMYRNS